MSNQASKQWFGGQILSLVDGAISACIIVEVSTVPYKTKYYYDSLVAGRFPRRWSTAILQKFSMVLLLGYLRDFKMVHRTVLQASISWAVAKSYERYLVL